MPVVAQTPASPEPEEVAVVDPFVGEIRLVPYTFAPQGWALCDGRLLPINQNQALFSLLGTSFGGDGKTTFALPDLRGRVPVGAGQGASGTTYEVGSTGGQESVKLSASQLPAHSHPVRASTDPGQTKSPATAVPASGGAYRSSTNAKMSAAMIDKTGGGKVHENRQPYLVLNYIIALQGIFPSRP
jgi:microcystin-dependent protein